MTMVIEAVGLGHMICEREVVTQLGGSPRQTRRDTEVRFMVSFPFR